MSEERLSRCPACKVITVCWRVHSCFQTIPCQTQGHIQYTQFKLTQHNIITVLLQIVYHVHSTFHSNQANNSEIGQFLWVHIKFQHLSIVLIPATLIDTHTNHLYYSYQGPVSLSIHVVKVAHFSFAVQCSAKTALNVNHYQGSKNTRSISNSVHLMIHVHLTFFDKISW
jgi:hypothetical protein